MRQLREDNAKLEQLEAELSMGKDMLQEVISKKTLKPARKRELAGWLIEAYSNGNHQECRLMPLASSSYYLKEQTGSCGTAVAVSSAGTGRQVHPLWIP